MKLVSRIKGEALYFHRQQNYTFTSKLTMYFFFGLMVSVLDSGSSSPGSSPGQGHCVVFLGKTLSSHSASLHPGV